MKNFGKGPCGHGYFNSNGFADHACAPPPPPHYKKLTTIFLLLWIKHINVKGKKFVPAVRGWYELGGDILVNLLPFFGQEPRRR